MMRMQPVWQKWILALARTETGVVMMITLGTGIGSAIFIDGILVPNTELRAPDY